MNKVAFEAGEKLGIPRVLEPENMAIKKIPDKLAVITYLHQLRSSLGRNLKMFCFVLKSHEKYDIIAFMEKFYYPTP